MTNEQKDQTDSSFFGMLALGLTLTACSTNKDTKKPHRKT